MKHSARIVVLVSSLLFACTQSDKQRITEPMEPHFSGEGEKAFVTLSDTNPTVGSIVTVTAYVHPNATSSVIGSFSARLSFDTTGLTFLDHGPLDGGGGIRAVNMHDGAVLAAGASVNGFPDEKLFTVQFRVDRPSALRSLIVQLNQLNGRLLGSDEQATKRRFAMSATDSGADTATGVFGDVNGDGQIDPVDAQLILIRNVGLPIPTGFGELNGDVNGDSKVSAVDAQIVLSFIVQIDVRQFRVGDNVNAPPVRITSITPSVLRPGTDATIVGENFSQILQQDTVLIDGISAEVLTASATQMTVRVPTSLQCIPEHFGSVSVRARGAGTEVQHPVSATRAIDIAIGQTLFLGDNGEEFACLELPGNTNYLMTVYNTARSLAFPIPFEFAGHASDGLTSTTQGNVSHPMPRHLPPVERGYSSNALRALLGASSPTARLAAGLRKHYANHTPLMAREHALMNTLRAKGATPLRHAAGATRGVAQNNLAPVYAISTTVGAYSSVKVHDPEKYDTYTTVRARTVYVGAKSIILEDSTSAVAGMADAYYRKLGAEFDNTIFPMLTENFGNPLAMDQFTDNNGKIIMLFTPVINAKFPGIAGFVTSCDFFGESACPASNRAEIFYATTPTNMGDGYTEGSVSGWYWTVRSTIAHEAKHITSFAERLSKGGFVLPESRWLEEGTAQIAAELFNRKIVGPTRAGWKSDANYQNTIYCELRPTTPGCLESPVVMFELFGWLSDYAKDTDNLSPIDPNEGTIYGSAWLIARWAADRFATNEASFFRALTQQATDTGIVNLEARAGVSWSSLVGGWGLAFAADANVLPASLLVHSVPSWDVADIFRGMSTDLRGQISATPLRRTSNNNLSFSAWRNAASGSFAVFALGAFAQKQAISVRQQGGAPLPSGSPLRLAIWRLY